MSLSKVSPFCLFCQEERALYKCPKCTAKYCSSKCFKHPEHNKCSETFYQDWVLSSLQNLQATKSDKEKMMTILKKVAVENDDICEKNEEPSIEDRFADIDLSKTVEEKELWERLTETEQKSFKEMLSNEQDVANILPVIQPWWVVNKITYVKNQDEDQSSVADRPPLPISIKPLSELTRKQPSDNIKYNIINVLFSYACLTRLYNNELRDFIEDVIDSIFILSPVFSENKNYSNLDEVVQDSIRLITNLHFKLDLAFAKSLSYDVYCIINGPLNAHQYSYIICALSDIKSLMLEFKLMSKNSESLKNIKQLLLKTVKKIDYFISWCVTFSDEIKPLAKEIEVKFFPEIIADIVHESSIDTPENKNLTESKVLIEELN